MSKVLTPEQFEQAARAEVGIAEAAVGNLHREIASLEARLNVIAGNPTTATLAEATNIEGVLAAKRSLVQRIKAHFNADRAYREYLDRNGKPILESFLREKAKIIESMKPEIASFRKQALELELANDDSHFDRNQDAEVLSANLEHFVALLAHARESLRQNNPYSQTINFLHQIQVA